MLRGLPGKSGRIQASAAWIWLFSEVRRMWIKIEIETFTSNSNVPTVEPGYCVFACCSD